MGLSLAGLDVDGSGFSKEDAIDVDKLAAQNARKKEVVHVVLQEIMRGEHDPDLPSDAEVLLDQELQQYGINTTTNIEALKERARLTTKAMLVARRGWVGDETKGDGDERKKQIFLILNVDLSDLELDFGSQ